MKIAILTSPNQWFISYAEELKNILENAKLFFNHTELNDDFDVLFILSYHKIIPKEYLKKNKHNIVVHASNLPQGKGWAPMFWQILENKNEIVFTMFEASNGVDDGDIYMQKTLHLAGYELHDTLREKQAKLTIDMCLEFINNYDRYKSPKKQKGKETFYKKRTPQDSQLDTDKTLQEQFNLLRIVDNENYPAFFELDGNRYVLKIELQKMGGQVTLLDFVNLDLEEKEMVLKWRNHKEIQSWMYDQEEISTERHLDFIDSLKYKVDTHYLLVKKEMRYIGTINFTKIDRLQKECYFGLYANPFEKVAGIGRILEEICIRYAFEILKLDKLKLEVFSDNERAIKLYKKFDFKQTGEKLVNNQKVICMELNKI